MRVVSCHKQLLVLAYIHHFSGNRVRLRWMEIHVGLVYQMYTLWNGKNVQEQARSGLETIALSGNVGLFAYFGRIVG